MAFFSDSFPTSGWMKDRATWTRASYDGAGAFGIGFTAAGRAYSNGGPAYWYANGGSPASADYDVEAVLWEISDLNNSGQPGIAGRVSTSALTGYWLNYDSATGRDRWTIWKYVAGVLTALGTWAEADWTGSSRTVKLQMRGSQIRAYINGIERISVTDTAITAAGQAGIFADNFSGSTGGVHIDDFSATDAIAATQQAAESYQTTIRLTTSRKPKIEVVNQAIAVPNYYVNDFGNDSTGTGSYAAPWRTIQKALDSAPDRSTISVGAGTYTAAITDTGTRERLTFVADGAATIYASVALRGYGLTFDGFTFRGRGGAAVNIGNPANSTTLASGIGSRLNFNNCTFTSGVTLTSSGSPNYGSDHGVTIHGASEELTFDGCTFNYLWNGIHRENYYSDSTAYRGDGLQVLNNTFTGIRGSGMFLCHYNNIEVRGNDLHSSRDDISAGAPDHSDFVQGFGNLNGLVVAQNRCYPGTERLQQCVFMEDGFGGGEMPFDDVLIENNLFYDLGTETSVIVTNKGGTNFVCRYNTIWVPQYSYAFWNREASGGSAATDTQFYGNIVSAFQTNTGAGAVTIHDYNCEGGEPATYQSDDLVATDPLFTDSANGDFTLQAGSPCIGAGDPNNYPATDIDGNPRSSTPTMGCYE